MDTFQSLNTSSRSRFGVFKLSKPKRLRARHGLPHRISEGSFVYRAISELDVDSAWGTWLGEQRTARGERRPVLLKHTGDSNRTRAGADALWLEALLTSKLEGPQVVPLVDYGVVDGRPFAVYDFEEGVFLAQVLEGLRDRNVQLPSSVAVGIILQACDLVARLHEIRLDEEEAVGGFVHGSLCPRNFVLTGRGDVRVMGLVGVRPVGRVVGREHVPAAAVDYASPDLLGGAPVTPAVDVHSLAAVLSELLSVGDELTDELGVLVRELVSSGRAARFSTVRGLAGALQDAVRRTGTVVARQSIASQVRDVCEQYMVERHKQVRALLDTEWPDEKDASVPESGVAPAQPSVSPLAVAPTVDPGAPVATGVDTPGASASVSALPDPSIPPAEPSLAQYDEESDDAVTRFMDDVAVGSQESPSQAPAWMNDNERPDEVGGGFSKWAVGGLMGVLIAICSVAAVVAWSSPEESEDLTLAQVAKETAPVVPPSVVSPADLPKVATPTLAVAELPVNAPVAAQVDEESAPDDAEPVENSTPAVAEKKAVEAKKVAPKPRARRSPARRRVKRATPVSEPEQEESEQEAVELPDNAPRVVRAVAIEDEPSEIVREMAAENDIEYEEAPKMAFLSVDASPYATVFIDGKKIGVTPIVRMELAPGPHRMVARNSEGETKRFTLMLEAGRTETKKITW